MIPVPGIDMFGCTVNKLVEIRGEEMVVMTAMIQAIKVHIKEEIAIQWVNRYAIEGTTSARTLPPDR